MFTWRPCHCKTINWAKTYPKLKSRTPSTCHGVFDLVSHTLNKFSSQPISCWVILQYPHSSCGYGIYSIGTVKCDVGTIEYDVVTIQYDVGTI